MEDVRVRKLLQHATNRLGMQLAHISRIDGNVMRVAQAVGSLDTGPLQPGTEFPYDETICAQVVGRGPAAIVPDTHADLRTRDLQAVAEVGVGAYVGAPIRRGGDTYGMLCCLSSRAQPELKENEAQILAFLADVLADVMDTEDADRRRREATTERIRSVLEAGGPNLQFQAIYDLPDLTVSGYEALSRFPAGFGNTEQWFVDAAEVGLGLDLELAAFANAVRALPRLDDRLLLSINLSPTAVADDRLPDMLMSASDPARILIEITEHDEISDYAALVTACADLKQLGVRIAADDTGAGYAGLQHLVELRPDSVKLDYHLVHGMDHDPARRAVAQALMTLCQEIGSSLLAEGIETDAELATAQHIGIRQAQGYLLHRPAPLAEALSGLHSQPTTHRVA